jgi:hypothetical protein
MNTILVLLLLSGAAGAQDSRDTDTAKPRQAVPAKPALAPSSASGETAPTPRDAGKEAHQPASAAPKRSPRRDEAEAGKPPAAPRELSPEAQARRDELRRCLAYYLLRPETAADRAPWGVMHAIVGFGVDTSLKTRAEQVNAIGWLCANQPCKGMRLFHAERGQVIATVGAGYQGHEGQFLQMMALSRVPQEFAVKVDGQRFTIADLVKREQLTCRARTELSFKLVGLAHYLDTKATWRNQAGESWNLERVIQEELAQPVNKSAACGGTHRLMGLGYAVWRHQQPGEPLTGQWARAKQTVDRFAASAFKLQNADGSFSTNWFEGPDHSSDIERRLNTTGHTLEWLLLSLADEQVQDPRLTRAAQFLTALMWRYRSRAWYIGAKGHALHALALYDERVFGGQPGKRHTELAQYAEAVTAEGPVEPRETREPVVPPATRRFRAVRGR